MIKSGKSKKYLQHIRLSVQLFCILLTAIGFFINFQITKGIILIATLVGGVYFCGWVCPYGSLQDLFSKLGKKLGIKKIKMPKAIQFYLKYLRYIILICVMIITLDIIFTIMGYDPRVNFLAILGGTGTTIIAIIIIISFLLISLFFERPFCNYFCMEGAKYGLISSFRFITFKRNTSTCINCKKCDKACPMHIEVSTTEHVSSIGCINCFQCASTCPVENTLTYGPIEFNANTKKRYLKLATLATIIAIIAGGYWFIRNQLTDDTASQSQYRNGKTDKDTTRSEASSTPDSSSKNAMSSDEATTVNEAVGEAKGIEDGVYEGIGDGFKGEMTVEVTIENEMITNISVIDHKDDYKWFNRANNIIPDSIVESQSTDTDVVSGATYSSQGIIEATKDALQSAQY